MVEKEPGLTYGAAETAAGDALVVGASYATAALIPVWPYFFWAGDSARRFGRSGLRRPESWFVPYVPSAFGEDAFGRKAEAAARFFGTPKYIAGQTAIVIAWIAVNAIAVGLRWDPYPFILLNLVFSTQAAYAAPLILLAQTRQADRDKEALDHLEAHREEVMSHIQEREAAIKKETSDLRQLIEANTALTQEDKTLTETIEALTREIHARLPSPEEHA